MSTYTPITKQEAKKYRKNYQDADENSIGTKFGPKVKDHYSTKKSKGKKSFRTFSMSFDPARNGVHGMGGLEMVITDLATSPLPMLTPPLNRYRIMLGLKDDGTRVDILAQSRFKGWFDDNEDVYFEISPSSNIDYERIIASAETWDAARIDENDKGENSSGGYSWHCDPHCP